jgi:hypothetical protein
MAKGTFLYIRQLAAAEAETLGTKLHHYQEQIQIPKAMILYHLGSQKDTLIGKLA